MIGEVPSFDLQSSENGSQPQVLEERSALRQADGSVGLNNRKGVC